MDRRLKAWEEAGLIDAAAAARIRDFEAERAREGGRLWPAVLAWVFGSALLCAGVLLFVAAHWDRLSPPARFALVLLMVATFHVAGALLRERYAVLGQVLHASGTVSLGAGIYLSGQIFNLQEHWPGAVMLWAAGAWLAWILLRDRIQVAFAALLTPVWLVGEWVEATAHTSADWSIPAEGTWLLCLAYLAARTPTRDGPVRHDLVRMGSVALLPLTLWVIFAGGLDLYSDAPAIPTGLSLTGWTLAYGGPLVLAWLMGGRTAWPALIAAAWVRLLGTVRPESFFDPDGSQMFRELSTYTLCAAGAALMAWWGTHEARPERINLGVAGFGLTVICFYFDNVMDKLGRSVSLMGMGLLLLLGGYALERTRRGLVARASKGEP